MPQKNSKPQYCFRCTESQSQTYEHTAEIEGYSSVAQWVADLVSRRASHIRHCLSDGCYSIIHGAVVPYDEVPGANYFECKFANASRFLVRDDPRYTAAADQEVINAVIWLANITAISPDEDLRERARALAASLPQGMVDRIDALGYSETLADIE